jgi:ATP-dependent DNA helicase DinG
MGGRDSPLSLVCAKCGYAVSPSYEVHWVSPKKRVTLADFFPYGQMRPFQKDVLQQIEAGLASSKKFIILEAPVGFGKSAVAAALCLYLGSAFLLTSTKQLEDQYSHDFDFPKLMGKSNFTCLVPTASGTHLACSKGRCEVDWKLSECPHFLSFEEFDHHQRGLCEESDKCERMKGKKLCPYYDHKWSGLKKQVTVCNYPFFLSEINYTGDIQHRKLLVCDEAHDLERQVVDFASFSLKRSTLLRHRVTDKSGKVLNDFVIPDKGVDDPVAWLNTLIQAKGALEQSYDAWLDEQDVAQQQDRLVGARNSIQALDAFVTDLKASPKNWVVNSVRRAIDGSSVEEVVFRPLNVGAYTTSIFETADVVLLMSATIFSKELLCSTLGIPADDACFISVPDSSFPVENRRLYALNTAQLSRASMESALQSIAQAVDTIMTNHAGERGVIHTTSYQQVNYIMQHVSEPNRTRLVTTEGSAERSSLLRTHGSTGASVLISPSLYQGVDLKDDMSRFQVVVKVPYPDLSDRRTLVKLQQDRGWYDWQTAQRLVQTYGRSVRSETDHAVTYVLDSNFTRFISEHRSLFPRYFLEALQEEERKAL